MNPSDVLWATPTPPERRVDGVEFARTASAAVDSIESGDAFSAVVVDYDLPDASPWRVVERARSAWPDVTAFLRGGRDHVESDGRPFCEYIPSRWSFGRALAVVGSAVESRRQRSYPVHRDEDRRLSVVGDLVPAGRPYSADELASAAVTCGVDAVAVSFVEDSVTRVVGASDPALLGERSRAGTACSYTVAADDLLRVGDLSRDPRFRRRSGYDRHGYRSYLGVPLRVDGVPVGAVYAVSREPEGVPPETRFYLTAYAKRAGHATRRPDYSTSSASGRESRT